MASANSASMFQDSVSPTAYEHASDPVDPARRDNLRRVVAAVIVSTQSDSIPNDDSWVRDQD